MGAGLSDDEIRSQLLQYARAAANGSIPDNWTHRAEVVNPACGDRVEISLVVEDGAIIDVGFDARGCALSTASAALAAEILPGRSVVSTIDILQQFSDALALSPDASWPEELAALTLFAHLRGNPGRQGCVLLPWKGVVRALNEGERG